MKILKHKESKISQNYFFIKGNLDLNCQYFIQKIEEGIKAPDNKNFQSNVQGEMTEWRYFCQDYEFAKIASKILDYCEAHNLLDKKVYLANAWGYKETFSNYTKRHSHHPGVLSGLIYLSNVDQPLIFDEINESVVPEAGNFALFSSFLYHQTKSRILDNKIKYGISFNFYEQLDSWEFIVYNK